MLLIFGLAVASPKQEVKCDLPGLSKRELVKIVVSELQRRAPDFKPTSENVRFTFSDEGCDHLVGVTALPEFPGGHEVFVIDRNGKIIKTIPGS
jgi:hypothetical protein